MSQVYLNHFQTLLNMKLSALHKRNISREIDTCYIGKLLTEDEYNILLHQIITGKSSRKENLDEDECI